MADESSGGYSGPGHQPTRDTDSDIPNAKSNIVVRQYRQGVGNFSEHIHAEVVIDGERRGVIRCTSEEEYKWIKDNLSGTRKRTKEERRSES